jgi:hypothetical protein
MKVEIAEVVWHSSAANKLGVKTFSGIFCLDSESYRIGQNILVRYEPADQFAYPVDMRLVTKLLEAHYAKV